MRAKGATVTPIEQTAPIIHPQTQCPFAAHVPVEMVAQVFQLADPVTVVSLALSCRYFWEIGLRYLQKVFHEDNGSWLGDRLIILGDYTRFDDLPCGIFNKDESAFIEHYNASIQAVETTHRDLSGGSDPPELMDVWDKFVLERCSPFGGLLSPKSELIRMLHRNDRDCQFAYNDYASGSYSIFYDAVPPADWPHEFNTRAHVLRNLVAKEYIRGDAFMKFHQENDLETTWRLADILVLRICWSSSDDIALQYDRNVHRGPWAGHRFDLIEKDWLTTGEGITSEWKDVSAAVLDDMLELFKGDYYA